MPPRKSKRVAAKVEAEAEEEESSVSTSAAMEGVEASEPPPKRNRRSSAVDEKEGANGRPPPPPPPIDDPPPPPADDGLPPPPPAEDVPPPPPSPPPVDVEALIPPPPPPEPSEDRRREVEEEQELTEEQIGGADYWANLAKKEEEGKRNAQGGGRDLYLDTINRTLLDFDFEKLCSISLSNINVYACLVCGKYFQGRGSNSYAYFHSINDDHRVFMNLETSDVYILPDNYKVVDSSLADIQYLLLPTYSEQHIKRLDAPDAKESFDLRANPYLPGFVGLNNLGANDYMNVVIQALAHVLPLRNFFLRGGPPPLPVSKGGPKVSSRGKTIRESDLLSQSSEIVRRFASLMRKIWNPRNFKAQVSPHEFLQEVVNASKGKFAITKQGDPIEFLGWLLNRLHQDLGGGGKKNKRSIISDCFMGHVRIESQKVFVRSGIELDDDEDEVVKDKMDGDGRKESGQEDALGKAKFNIDREVKVDRTSFFLLTIDLPPLPVFQDVIEKNIIPQVPISEVLAKYDGVTFQEARGLIRRYKALKLPPFLILHFKRFTKNNFVEERNRTIVNYPVKQLSMADYIDDPSLAPISSMYDLVANVTLEATAGTVRENSIWRSQVHTAIDGQPIGTTEERQERLRMQKRKAEDKEEDVDSSTHLTEEEKWFSIQDLLVETIDKQLLFLGETYVQIWARKV